MTTVHAPITFFAKPQVERSRGFSITNTFTDRSRPFTFCAKPQVKRSRTVHGKRSRQPFTFPTAPLGQGNERDKKEQKSASIKVPRRHPAWARRVGRCWLRDAEAVREHLEGKESDMPKVRRCNRCGRRWRGQNGWNVDMIAGIEAGYLCPGCQSADEDLDAELNLTLGDPRATGSVVNGPEDLTDDVFDRDRQRPSARVSGARNHAA